MSHEQGLACDVCGALVPPERLRRYDRNANHDCATSGHFCSNSCYRSTCEMLD